MSGAVAPQRIWMELTWLREQQRQFRFRRAIKRMLSPRRIIASSLTVFFLVAYLLNGAYILSAREAADPQRLTLWLSGGMVIYGIYYSVRCAWSQTADGLEMTAAENLWLGGAPISRRSLIVNQVAGLIPPAMMKTLLLAVVLTRDVNRPELMVIGVLISLVLLEVVRASIARIAAGLSPNQQMLFRLAATSIAVAAVVFAISTISATTPLNSPTWVYALSTFSALGHVAACDAIQWLSLPWIAPAHLAVTEHYTLLAIAQLIISLAMIPLATWILFQADRWSSQQVHLRDRRRLESGHANFQTETADANKLALASSTEHWVHSLAPESVRDIVSIASRHWVSVCRYRWMILANFVVPTLLCLSPLATGQEFEQWLYIVGGVALCTMLLAPPALKIDFRRDLHRMMLVRSLPVHPRSMVIGTLLAPIAITWVFQWVTIALGAWATAVDLRQIILWTGMMNALAVFTFACENALFLAYPHHEKAEGIGMMIRAKLTFLGKGTVLATAMAFLLVWSVICRSLPESIHQGTFVGGAIFGTWLAAAMSLSAATFCWRRFDLSSDIPPR